MADDGVYDPRTMVRGEGWGRDQASALAMARHQAEQLIHRNLNVLEHREAIVVLIWSREGDVNHRWEAYVGVEYRMRGARWPQQIKGNRTSNSTP